MPVYFLFVFSLFVPSWRITIHGVFSFARCFVPLACNGSFGVCSSARSLSFSPSIAVVLPSFVWRRRRACFRFGRRFGRVVACSLARLHRCRAPLGDEKRGLIGVGAATRLPSFPPRCVSVLDAGGHPVGINEQTSHLISLFCSVIFLICFLIIAMFCVPYLVRNWKAKFRPVERSLPRPRS